MSVIETRYEHVVLNEANVPIIAGTNVKVVELVLGKIAYGWSDKTATNLSKMILLKQYSRKKWETYWKEKLGIKGYFDIRIQSLELSPCKHF